MSQEPVLFAGSIEENIKYGNPDASHEEVVQAGKDANAHDFICALDDGYETDVGEAGTQMSGTYNRYFFKSCFISLHNFIIYG